MKSKRTEMKTKRTEMKATNTISLSQKSLAPSASLPPHQAPNLLRRLAQSQAQNRLPIRAPMPDRPLAQALEAAKVLTTSGRVMAVRNPPHHAKLSGAGTKPSSSTAV
eukprot:3209155-Prymnesium_polylepis.1